MHTLLDILASGVHDTKNQLFQTDALLRDAEQTHGVDLAAARSAIGLAASRLNRTLAAYRLLRNGGDISVVPSIVSDLIDEIALEQRPHLQKLGLALDTDCQVIDEWAFDRDLVADMLNNAIQNAARFARRRICLNARTERDWLVLRVDDDGPGFASLPPSGGLGLRLAARLAELHVSHGRQGSLKLDNHGALDGASFELWLP